MIGCQSSTEECAAMARILVTRQLPPGGLDPLEGHELVQREDDRPFTHEELVAAVAGVEAVVCLLTDRIDAEVIEAGQKLAVIGNVAVGYDNVDVEAATRAGVAVCNTPGVLDETTADVAFGLMLAASRRFGEAERDLRAGRWHGWNINQYLGHDVHGAILGLVGYGRIGQAMGRRASGFGMRVLHHTRHPTGQPGHVASLDELLATADVVSLHVPLSEHTWHLIGARELGLMKPSAVLVNTARGPVVDSDALADALESGRIFAAGLDVFEGEPEVPPRLLAAPRTVLLPHIGSGSLQTRTAMARMAADGVRAVLAGERPDNLIAR
jgi:glyoxylate reductase